MKRNLLILLFLCAYLCGCETIELWRDDKDYYYLKVVIPDNSEDPEKILKTTGKQYYCDNAWAEFPKKTCYIKTRKSTLELSKEVGVKLYKTPVALAVDAGKTIIVVGYIAIAMLSNSPNGYQGSIH